MTAYNPIEIAEREIQRDKDDLKRLKKRYPGYDFVPLSIIQMDSIQQATPASSAPEELAELDFCVLATVESDPKREWTSRNVFEVMRADDAKLPAKDEAAMNAVGYSLVKLLNAAKIVRSHEGRGRDPHRYRGVPEVEKEVTPEETTS